MRRTGSASNLKQIGYGVHLYSSDYDEQFPENLAVLYEQDYLKDHRFFVCPTVARRMTRVFGCNCKELPQGYESYCYASGVQPTDPPEYVVAFDEESNHDRDGVNVLFVGGNVEWRNDLNWLHDQLEKQRKDLAAQGRSMTLLRPGWSSPPADGLSWK